MSPSPSLSFIVDGLPLYHGLCRQVQFSQRELEIIERLSYGKNVLSSPPTFSFNQGIIRPSWSPLGRSPPWWGHTPTAKFALVVPFSQF